MPAPAMTAEQFYTENIDWHPYRYPTGSAVFRFAEAYAAHVTEELRSERDQLKKDRDHWRTLVRHDNYAQEHLHEATKRAEQAEQERDRLKSEVEALKNAPSGGIPASNKAR